MSSIYWIKYASIENININLFVYNDINGYYMDSNNNILTIDNQQINKNDDYIILIKYNNEFKLYNTLNNLTLSNNIIANDTIIIEKGLNNAYKVWKFITNNQFKIIYDFKNAAGTTGPEGPRGNAGLYGPRGRTGPIGPTGSNGLIGPTGPNGLLSTYNIPCNITPLGIADANNNNIDIGYVSYIKLGAWITTKNDSGVILSLKLYIHPTYASNPNNLPISNRLQITDFYIIQTQTYENVMNNGDSFVGYATWNIGSSPNVKKTPKSFIITETELNNDLIYSIYIDLSESRENDNYIWLLNSFYQVTHNTNTKWINQVDILDENSYKKSIIGKIIPIRYPNITYN